MKYERIEINPHVMLGKPVIRGTRIPVELILRKLGEDATEADLLEAYPRLKHADIQAALAERTCLRIGSGAVQGARKGERLIEKEDGAAVQSRARICLRIM